MEQQTYWQDQVVLVHWIDSFKSPGWEPLEDKLRDDHSAGSCRSVGWVIQDDDDWLAITQGWSGDKAADTTLFIPKVAVKSITALNERASLTTWTGCSGASQP